jgi:hypothetical protein
MWIRDSALREVKVLKEETKSTFDGINSIHTIPTLVKALGNMVTILPTVNGQTMARRMEDTQEEPPVETFQ